MNRKTALIIVLVFALALGGEYVVLTKLLKQTDLQTPVAPPPISKQATPTAEALPQATKTAEVPRPGSSPYILPVSMGDLGPRLVEVGAIDLGRFIQLYEVSGAPLTSEQQTVLIEMSSANLVVDRSNAYFLLNLFWALGLTNSNPILTDRPMMTYSEGKIERFASTGGWTIGTQTAADLYASEELISLTPEQQLRLGHVAHRVFRSCCNNPTDFPDCNHGMAMLGLLELLAATDATEDEMFAAAKVVNAVWFPVQTAEIALYAQHALNTDWDSVAPQTIVGSGIASGTGFQNVHQWLAARNLLPTTPGGGNGCGL